MSSYKYFSLASHNHPVRCDTMVKHLPILTEPASGRGILALISKFFLHYFTSSQMMVSLFMGYL